ncbi:hypothetical protein [uncultured Clostridium sp.]|jgi:hypothetical protein|uniref:hypothetical protein n=1 Tax=uncultured Clostridium sp. TaxID=59620 RepID=UPI00272D1038|nr:hypothetical protein [uncultured Clostridium sp.]
MPALSTDNYQAYHGHTDILDELQLNSDIDKSSPVTAVFVHYDEEKVGDKKITVSVGISGQARGSKHNDEYARELERSLNEMAGYEKYVVSSITDPDLFEQIKNMKDKINILKQELMYLIEELVQNLKLLLLPIKILLQL